MNSKLDMSYVQIMPEHLDEKEKNQLSGCFVYITSQHVALHRQNIQMIEYFLLHPDILLSRGQKASPS